MLPPGRRPESLQLLLLPLLLLLLAVAAVAAAAGEDCGERAPAARYSSKTAYQLVHGEDLAPQDKLQGCTPVYWWHLLRHGTRYPSAKEIGQLATEVPALQAKIGLNVAAGRSRLCPAEADRILGWTLRAATSQGNALQAQGERDLFGIASRFKDRYPSFFANRDRQAFDFRSTDSQRTKASAAWYGHGLFGQEAEAVVPTLDDTLLKFYAHCPAWDEAVDNNKSARAEVTRFQDGAVVRAALGRVSARLGFEQPLAYEEVDLLWEACRYDQAWDPTQEAAWCAAFDDEDRLVFEYRADLKYYYVGGYGNAMDLRLGCPLVKDLVDKLSGVVAGTAARGSGGVMYFTHSTAVHMTMARLGLGRDAAPLTADSYEAMKLHRQWDISQLGPFAANIAVALYECRSGEQYKLRMFVNEKPVAPEGWGCDDALCSWTAFQKRFASVSSDCSLDFCQQRGSAAQSARWSSWAGAAAIAAVLVHR